MREKKSKIWTKSSPIRMTLSSFLSESVFSIINYQVSKFVNTWSSVSLYVGVLSLFIREILHKQTNRVL